jgi:hypothetical protein
LNGKLARKGAAGEENPVQRRRARMKKSLPLIMAVFFLGGCAMYHLPVGGKLDSSTEKELQSIPSSSVDLGIYLEKGLTEAVITRKAEGATCGHTKTQIRLGPALGNALWEALSVPFPKAKLLDKPEQTDNSMVMKIDLEKVDLGFEYSVWGGCDRPLMDQARIFTTLKTEIIKSDRQALKDTSVFEAREEETEIPPPSQTGVLEKCLNKIALQYVEKIKEQIK